MSNLHPVFAAALAPFAPPSSAVHLDAYRAALASFDWQFEHTDEHRRWAAGTNALARLHRQQRQLDPSGEIWMQTPGAQTHGAPQPCLLEAA